jgi:threonine aldolase
MRPAAEATAMINLRSDTVTRPDEAMRDAARDAEVGDDVHGRDPTVNELEARAAEVVGTEDALFVPSGTMGNQIAVRVHADRGTELLCDVRSHVFKWELGGAAQLSGVQTRTLPFDGGAPTPEQVREHTHDPGSHAPGTGLLALENSHNDRGGLAVPLADLAAAADAARESGVPVHLDGARLFNAATALGVDAAEVVDVVDSVMFCLSKGLGAPVGSMLAGPTDFVSRARRARKLLGGGMRQAGVVAAPGLLALENRHRLGTDHDRARRLAAGLDAVAGLSVPAPETNLVYVDSSAADLPAQALVDACESRGVLAGTAGEYRTRFCTHRDVDDDDVTEAIARVERAVTAASPAQSSGST